ncbi:MAG: hypothetical protein KAH38_12685 [Candidatus Hydrogenedentes bacterium]|nr:hypothetical protein [Candidatus Hydrogenedentota bacterium]
MPENISPPPRVSEGDPVRTGRALHLIALFVVVMIPLLVHFNLLYAPMQGGEFQLLLFDDLLQHPHTAITALDRLPASPLSTLAIGFFWWLGGGSMILLRTAALLTFVFTAMVLFQVLRLWLSRRESITAPMLGAVLFAVSPAAVDALANLNALPVLLGTACASAAAVLFLKATRKNTDTDYLSLVLASIALALAAAAHPGMLLLPVILIVLDLSRLTAAGRLRLQPAWTAWGLMLMISAAAAAVLHYSGASFTPLTPPVPLLLLSSAAAFFAAGLLVLLPGKNVQRVFSIFMIVLLSAGGIFSFKRALPYVDPIPSLKQQIAEREDPVLRDMLVLHYIESAQRETSEETRFALLQEALAIWQEQESGAVNATRRILGEHIFDAGYIEEAASLLEPFLSKMPFTDTGYKATIALARTRDEMEEPGQIADYYALARKTGSLSPDDVIRYGKVLIRMGDTTHAAQQFARLLDPPEQSEAGRLQKQSAMAYNAAEELWDKARQQMADDPTNPLGYVNAAERELLLGNKMRAFYWLELALRREPEQERAWALMGNTLARSGQANQFIAQWGSTKAQGDGAWLLLAKQTAMFQAWEGALLYASQFTTPETPTAEELLGAFALEMKNIQEAKNWFKRAAEAHPKRYTAWLALSDISTVMQQPEDAQHYLDEAERCNAPAEEVKKRRARSEGTNEEEAETEAFKPVRSYLQ